MVRLYAALSLVFLLSTSALAVPNQFRTRANTDWNLLTTWEEFISGTWVPATTIPSSASGVITITHAITITTPGISVDQATVSSGGSITISDLSGVTIDNGIGPDLIVDGLIVFVGESFVTGAGNIVINGSLQTGSLEPTGGIVSGTTAGSIRVTKRTFNSGAIVTYNGVGAQAIGSGHPATLDVHTRINNSSGVALNNSVSATVTIGGDLTIIAGDLDVTNNSIKVNGNTDIQGGSVTLLATSSSRSFTTTDLNLSGGTLSATSGAATANVTVNGILTLGGGDITVASGAGNATLTVSGDIVGSSHFIQSSGANTNVTINGTGTLTNSFPFATGSSYKLITLNRSGATLNITRNIDLKGLRLSAGNAVLSIPSFSIKGDLNLASGTTFTFNGSTLDLQAHLNNSLTGGLLVSNSSSRLTLTGTVALGPLAFSPSGNTLKSFIIDRSVPGIPVTLNSALSVTDSVYLKDGVFANTSGLSVSSGAIIIRNSAGSISTSVPLGGPYRLLYEGTSNLSTGVEAQGSLTSVTTQNTATVTLTSALTASGALTISSGSFTSGANAVSVATITNNGIFNASSGTVTVTGNITNNGTFNRNNGTVRFNGNSTILGSNTPTFQNVNITGTLNGSNFIIAGNFLNNGSFVAGSGRITFTGTAAQSIQGSSTSTFFDLVINKTSTTTVTLTSPVTVADSIILTLGKIDNTAGKLTMASGSVIKRFSGTSLIGVAPLGGPYKVVYGGAGVITTALEAQGLLSDVINNSTGIVIVATSMNVPGNLIMNSGTFSNSAHLITMGNGATVTRNSAAAITGSAPAGGPYNLIYTGSSLTNGLESAGSLNNVTSMVSGTVTFGSSLNTPGLLTITSGIFTSGANAIAIGAVLVNGTFVAPSTTLTITGDFTDNSVFTHNGGTVIFNGTSNVGGTSLDPFNNITIAGTLNGGSTSIPLDGNFLNNGVLAAQTGTIRFTGSAPQTIGGSAVLPNNIFNNIQVSNTAGVSVETDQNLIGVLSLDNGTQFDGDGSTNAVFTLLSLDDTPETTGSVGPLLGGAVVNDNVNVQRFMKTKGNTNRYISSPVAGAIASDLLDDYDVQSMRWYEEAVTGAFNQGYHAVGISDPLVVGRGYLASPVDPSIDITWDVRNNINQGSINLNVTHTNSVPANPNNDGWNLVGNPYPSSVHWDNGTGWTKVNIAPIAYVPDVQFGPSVWRTWNATTQTGDLPNGVIASGQAFWVYVNVGGGSLTINETAKNSSLSGEFFRTQSAHPVGLTASLSYKGMTDNSYLLIRDDATNKFDLGLDGYKREGTIAVSFVDSEGGKLVSNAIREFDASMDIPMDIAADEDGEYELRLPLIAHFAGYNELYLVDTYLNKNTKVSTMGAYRFSVTSNDLTRHNRFYLSTVPERVAVAEGTMKLSTYPNPVTDKLKVEVNSDAARYAMVVNSFGQVVGETILKQQEGISVGVVDMIDRPIGMYFVKVVVGNKVLIEKIVKK